MYHQRPQFGGGYVSSSYSSTSALRPHITPDNRGASSLAYYEESDALVSSETAFSSERPPKFMRRVDGNLSTRSSSKVMNEPCSDQRTDAKPNSTSSTRRALRPQKSLNSSGDFSISQSDILKAAVSREPNHPSYQLYKQPIPPVIPRRATMSSSQVGRDAGLQHTPIRNRQRPGGYIADSAPPSNLKKPSDKAIRPILKSSLSFPALPIPPHNSAPCEPSTVHVSRESFGSSTKTSGSEDRRSRRYCIDADTSAQYVELLREGVSPLGIEDSSPATKRHLRPSMSDASSTTFAGTPPVTFSDTESDNCSAETLDESLAFPAPPPIPPTLRRLESSPHFSEKETTEVRDFLRRHWDSRARSQYLPSPDPGEVPWDYSWVAESPRVGQSGPKTMGFVKNGFPPEPWRAGPGIPLDVENPLPEVNEAHLGRVGSREWKKTRGERRRGCIVDGLGNGALKIASVPENESPAQRGETPTFLVTDPSPYSTPSAHIPGASASATNLLIPTPLRKAQSFSPAEKGDASRTPSPWLQNTTEEVPPLRVRSKSTASESALGRLEASLVRLRAHHGGCEPSAVSPLDHKTSLPRAQSKREEGRRLNHPAPPARASTDPSVATAGRAKPMHRQNLSVPMTLGTGSTSVYDSTSNARTTVSGLARRGEGGEAERCPEKGTLASPFSHRSTKSHPADVYGSGEGQSPTRCLDGRDTGGNTVMQVNQPPGMKSFIDVSPEQDAVPRRATTPAPGKEKMRRLLSRASMSFSKMFNRKSRGAGRSS